MNHHDDEYSQLDRLLEVKSPQDALRIVEDILKDDPENVRALFCLGRTRLALFQASQAKETFEKVLMLDSKHAGAYFYLGRFAEEAGRHVDAERFFDCAVKYDPSQKQFPMQLAKVQHLQQKNLEALKTLSDAENNFSESGEFTFARGQIASRVAPAWHLPMLADKARNNAYETAINEKVRPDDIVLDIGAGSGLLSMMAARAGAAHVYACEGNSLLAEIATEVIDRNGYADKITVIAKPSTDLIIGEDLPSKCDLLVTEIFDNALLGEGFAPTFRHAQTSLLKPDARVIPEGASLYGCLVSSSYVASFHGAREINGFDLSPMNVIAHPLSYKDAVPGFFDNAKNEKLTDSFLIHDYDFQSTFSEKFKTQSNVSALKAGGANMVLFWFSLRLADGINFSTENVGVHQHWRQVYQPLQMPYDCKAGELMNVRARFDRYFEFDIIRGDEGVI